MMFAKLGLQNANPVGRIKVYLEAGYGFNNGGWGQWKDGHFIRRFEGPPQWATPEAFEAVRMSLSENPMERQKYLALERRYRQLYGKQIAESGYPPLGYFINKGARLGQSWFEKG